MSKPTDLERTEELFAFLQGEVPDTIHIDDASIPHLTAEQAWNVIWYLGTRYWQVTDYIARCGVCGDLYDTNSEGWCLDYGNPPYHFCGACENGEEYEAKAAAEAAKPTTE